MKPSKFTFISPPIYDPEFIDSSPKHYLPTRLQKDTHISLSNALSETSNQQLVTWKEDMKIEITKTNPDSDSLTLQFWE
jgi:hypothetical protein